MAIKESDTDDVRRKIDEQDRLDAEEIMVNAMLESSAAVAASASGKHFGGHVIRIACQCGSVARFDRGSRAFLHGRSGRMAEDL